LIRIDKTTGMMHIEYMTATQETKKEFKAGNEYSCRSVCDYNCIFTFTILKRTAKTVTFKSLGNMKTARIKTDDDGNEWIYPTGQYSMAPVLRA
jgi:hypothetical protein